jgi:hypothetical protein
MTCPIHVSAYSGYKANERPQSFTLRDENYDIAIVEDRWYEPEAQCFKVLTSGGQRCVIRYDPVADRWTLRSGFDGATLQGLSESQ